MKPLFNHFQLPQVYAFLPHLGRQALNQLLVDDGVTFDLIICLCEALPDIFFKFYAHHTLQLTNIDALLCVQETLLLFLLGPWAFHTS